MSETCLVVTSIASDDHPVLVRLAQEASVREIPFIVIGDTRSPAKFELTGCDFYSIERQHSLDFSLSESLPTGHYARKNIGYLLAMQAGAEVIKETDDDNFPYDDFWDFKEEMPEVSLYQDTGWTNVYQLFSDKTIWPRGFSLDHIRKAMPPLPAQQKYRCPIRQGLANDNPDVDALYRMTGVLPVKFEADKTRLAAMGRNSWCPFNSQNTTWFKEAFPLLYLPSFCSFRMTDIWRSFVAQRICWENNWAVMFHHATVWQERNDHNLMRDFADEIEGYLHNHTIVQELERLPLKAGPENLPENLLLCYEQFIRMGLIDRKEINLIKSWLNDLATLNC
jgi:hypothetical protein